MVDACKQNHVAHVIFSGMESTKEEMGIEVPCFDTKAEIEQYIKEQKVRPSLN